MSTVLEQANMAPTGAATAPQADVGLSPQDAHRLGVVRHLIASMMLGQMYGLRDEVTQIFDAVAKMMGDGRELRISLAIASAVGGDVAPAHELLAEGMDDWPNPAMARVSVAFALKVGGDPQWTAIVEQVLAISDDETTRRFARQMLETPHHSELEL